MSNRRRLTGLVIAGILITGAIFIGAAAFAWRHEPQFYRVAIAVNDQQQRESCDQMLTHVAAVASAVHHQGKWSASFTDDEINGWLAVDLEENYPGMLPSEVKEPRLQMSRGSATIACRFEEGSVTAVVSLDFEAYMAEPGVLALRLRDMRAGAIPLPLSKVIDGLTEVATSMQLPLRWTKAKGQPVALVTLPALGAEQSRYELENLELRDGSVFLAGRTYGAGSPGRTVTPPTASHQPSPKMNVQR